MSEYFEVDGWEGRMQAELRAEHERRQKEEELDEGNSTEDVVNHPNHYNSGRFETIEIIEEVTKGYDDGYVAYCVGNAIKYLSRAPFKHEEPTEDLRKAAKYLEFANEYLTEGER